ncbi:MAG: ABC transporter ATP-binding protein [Parcubacteria group bacterium Gr01-1014_3]|nr:MAG: ABC transporter ATP-binding protein [Parcubacteria group bacterium Gr01-1014_3]
MTANWGDVVLKFNKVSFAYGPKKTILDSVDFVIRERAKLTLMGQNGAGKSTIFKLISKEIQPEEGSINIKTGATIATSMQVIPKDWMNDTVIQYFERAFSKKVYDIEPRINKILNVVNLKADLKKKMNQFSGGQQARLLLAFALIQNPDILLLDEPTNNLDKVGIEHLTKFLIEYSKTCVVISHDAHFLNSFTHGVLYLDNFSGKVEQYVGDYMKVVAEIAIRIERERKKNAMLKKDIENRKEQMNYFAQKGGKMRDVARKMREAIQELESQLVDLRQEDKTIKDFIIPVQSFEGSERPDWKIVEIKAVNIMTTGKPSAKKVNIVLKRKEKLLISGPNGIGKSTLLEALASGKAKGMGISDDIKIGYYKQDFSGLDFDETVYKTLSDAMTGGSDQELRSAAAQFLLDADLLNNKVGSLSEGQKGLLSFARFVLQRPGLLIMDEPTNHINFRHLPAVAKALDKFEGALILVSHSPEFIKQINIDHKLDLGDL